TKMEQIDHVLLALLHFKGSMECYYVSDKVMGHINGMDVVLSRGDDNNVVNRIEMLDKMMDLINEFEVLEVEYCDATGFNEIVKRGDILLKFKDKKVIYGNSEIRRVVSRGKRRTEHRRVEVEM
ncbi:MAG: hypothetical protein ACRCZ1_04135, partial [Cetobacterium sp.]